MPGSPRDTGSPSAPGAGPRLLAGALTRRSRRLCLGLDGGQAPILDKVTPTTAALLRWWFGRDAGEGHAPDFHPAQRQAILNTLVAHEVLAGIDLPDLYLKACPELLLESGLLGEITRPGHGHPQYGLVLAAGAGTIQVLLALLAWQVLNATGGRDRGDDDPRFSRRVLVVAPDLDGLERLHQAFLGRLRPQGGRDFASADVCACAGLLPPVWRERHLQWVREHAGAGAGTGPEAAASGMLTLTHPGALAEAGGHLTAFLAGLPDLVVFNVAGRQRHGGDPLDVDEPAHWPASLDRIAGHKGRHFVRIDLSPAPFQGLDDDPGTGTDPAWPAHRVVDPDLPDA